MLWCCLIFMGTLSNVEGFELIEGFVSTLFESRVSPSRELCL